jgi:hypothetical protein
MSVIELCLSVLEFCLAMAAMITAIVLAFLFAIFGVKPSRMGRMKVIYRGDCEEMYGREIEVPDHDCEEHMEHKSADHVETHGLDWGPYERWHEEWWECSICGEREE